jgi:hypothetical protein
MAAGLEATGTVRVGSHVLTAVVTFWDMTTCSHFKLNRLFQIACQIHLSSMLGFDPEDRGDMLLRNVG